ncbi:Protein kinase domain-containing protein [Mycena kentingensis (nom. inval.)]|nr:Protein kinase domain-containing protein [Mycena kentingensis (nom. inval.)]
MSQYPGTLVPGQSISVNKYTVQVERYLSQGGFAHVYLVRTATPVYNTTHHVLKRIAVSNDAMLTEVKKEVDIMRLLKGHPNIVHLIDAAWHRMPNGLYEVFILMEFCPGGGIIDMMNRRLRERLTEAEILQIFVDVLEGVAYMHNSRPPLLHRDLKVENILQSSATSFKLCDFGSATTVSPRPPATMQEIRALEADLNRHTTLQYRAPEMVDPYMRRPVDEKSDVWALGVLLYKLCYYTTPFEEHGPLAILNVQYRIPPYPVYSQQMNALIASMLREHGHQRPTVFELLNTTHRLRGTKSQFSYTIPTPQPLSPRNQVAFPTPANAIESTVTYRSQQQPQAPSKNPGVQARDKVLEAIAPMRRGRPTNETRADGQSHPRSRTTSPHKQRPAAATPQPVPEKPKNWLDEEDKAWKAATIQSGSSVPKRSALDDAWLTRGSSSTATNNVAAGATGFGDDFAEKLWDEFDTRMAATTSPQVPQKQFGLPPRQPSSTTAPTTRAVTSSLLRRYGKARLLRTGLAGMSSTSSHKYSSGDYKDYAPSRPTPSPGPQPSFMTHSTSSPVTALSSTPASASQALSPPPPPAALKPTSSGSSWLSRPPSSIGVGGTDDAAEARFPSLEDLDRKFGSSSASPPAPSPSSNGYQPASIPALPPRRATPEVLRADYKPAYASASSSLEGARSPPAPTSARVAQPIPTPALSPSVLESSRPPLTRKHRSSLTMKHAYSSSVDEPLPAPLASSRSAVSAAVGLSSSPAKTRERERDWLTGDDTDDAGPASAPAHSASYHSRTATTPAREQTQSQTQSRPVMRESPSKRASVIEKAPLHMQVQEAVVVQGQRHEQRQPETPSSPTARAQQVFPVLDLSDEPENEKEPSWARNREKEKEKEVESASSADEGPEDAVGRGFRSAPLSGGAAHSGTGTRHKARQSSVHDLVDLYGGAKAIMVPSKDAQRVSPGLGDEATPRKSAFSATSPQPSETKAKRQSAALAAVSITPSAALSAPNSGRPQPSSSPRSNKSPATSPTSATSPKSRPQSMFLFPSSPKPTDQSVPAQSLSPPASEAPKPRAGMRRTSISDMVHRYESFGGPSAAGGRSSVSPVPPPQLSGPSKSLGGARAENGRLSSISSSSTSTSSSSNGRSGILGLSEINKAAVSPTGVAVPRTASTPQQERETVPIATPRARRQSFKSVDMGVGPSPSRKSTLDSNASEQRSPSPDRPYQGVGKLIDQWQRKTAETEAPARGSPSKRGGLVAKRAAGLVGKP